MSEHIVREVSDGSRTATHDEQIDALRARVAELEQTVVARDDFVSMLGHELRNPLSPIFLQLSTMIDHVRCAQNDRVEVSWLAPQLERFSARLEHFIGMLTRLMEFSRLKAGGVDLQCEDVTLAEVLSDVRERFDRQLAVAGIDVSMRLDWTVTGMWDRMRLEQIFTNLMSNAIRYGRGHPVEIVVEGDLASARCVVRDHGIGIAADDQERIFERFDQVTSSRHAGGFGLGLWVVKQLCTAMRGRIELHSELGKGTTFVVSLPRSEG